LIPGSIAPTDGPGALSAVGWQAQSAYGTGQFAKLDALIETLSQPDQITDDGMPRLQGVYDGLWSFLYAYKDWQTELDKSKRPTLTVLMMFGRFAWQAYGYTRLSAL
jgi:hypothetical protein